MAKLPRARVNSEANFEQFLNILIKAIIMGVIGYMLLMLVLVISIGCKRVYEMTEAEAKVYSARITESPVSECWGFTPNYQCRAWNGKWTTCNKYGCVHLVDSAEKMAEKACK